MNSSFRLPGLDIWLEEEKEAEEDEEKEKKMKRM